MIGRIVEVADDRRHLFLSRGFLVVQDTEAALQWEFSRLGFALWPEQHQGAAQRHRQFSRLGFALWPELFRLSDAINDQFSRLGFAL